jgi:hypothetical protein
MNNIFSKSFFPSTLRLWNSLEPNFKSIQTTSKFKQNLRANLFKVSKGRIQDFVLGGTNVGEGSGDRLRPLDSGSRAELLGFEYLGSFSVNNFEVFCECD